MINRELFDSEIQRAESARAAGNEGQARVSARRAAGIVLRDYMIQRGISVSGLSAFDLIEIARTSPEFSPEVVAILSHLTIRVAPGGAFPREIDLLSEVRWLADILG